MSINKNIHWVNWPIPEVLAFTTTRDHPFQNNRATFSSPFDHFNLGLHVNDNPEQVLANRATLKNLLKPHVDIQWLEQVHGHHVITIDKVLSRTPKADAAYTNKKNIALAIMTADCLPILISTTSGNEIAVVHGGWRPLAQNILAHTLTKFTSPMAQLHAWLGPCIGQEHFEVGADVKAAFMQQSAIFASAFKPIATNKYLADLHLIAQLQLTELGVKHIYQQADCTFAQNKQYYSYRRDQQTGRMASIICAY